MKVARTLLLAATAMDVAGCCELYQPETPSEPPLTAMWELKEKDLAPYQRQGDSNLLGQALLRKRGGEVVTCAGAGVMLIPRPGPRDDTWLVSASNIARHRLLDVFRYGGTTRVTKCGVDGRFSFEGLPPGTWIVMTYVLWEAPRPSTMSGCPMVMEQQGGAVAQFVSTWSDADTEIVLSDSDKPTRW